MSLKIGKKAPDFTLPSTSGKKFTLSQDCKGKACIIYFYPKDFTKVCTAEACDFRDQFGAFREKPYPIPDPLSILKILPSCITSIRSAILANS